MSGPKGSTGDVPPRRPEHWAYAHIDVSALIVELTALRSELDKTRAEFVLMRDENARLRAALEKIWNCDYGFTVPDGYQYQIHATEARRIAREALKEKK